MTHATDSGADDPRWATFLDRLSETSNIQGSAKMAGLTKSAIYVRKRRDPAFAKQMLGALADGYDALEFLVLHIIRTGDLEAASPAALTPTGKLRRTRRHDLASAMRILAIHRETVAKVRAERGEREGRPRGEVQAALEAKLDALKARRAAARRPQASKAP